MNPVERTIVDRYLPIISEKYLNGRPVEFVMRSDPMRAFHRFEFSCEGKIAAFEMSVYNFVQVTDRPGEFARSLDAKILETARALYMLVGSVCHHDLGWKMILRDGKWVTICKSCKAER